MDANQPLPKSEEPPLPVPVTGEICTLGYGARSLDEFLSILRGRHIDCLVDVRTAPYSKFKPEFAREFLRHAVERCGIRYLFLGDALGGQPQDPTCQTGGKVDYDKVRAKSFFLAGLDCLRTALAQGQRLALMCSEGRPEHCHRSKLIGQALAADGIPVVHIDEDGRVLTQQQVIDRLTQGQLDLFGPPSFTSRKRHGLRDEKDSPAD
jgi:uncharacterized protein (DUF488 family)